MNSRSFLKIVFFTLGVIMGTSVITLKASNNLQTDLLPEQVRCPDSSFIASYRTQKEFIYSSPPVKTNFLKKLWNYLQKRFNKLSKITAALPWVMKALLALLMLFSLFIIITQTKLYKIFYTEKETESPKYILSNVPHQWVNYNQQIQTQVSQKQYRLAIRLLYLKVIQQLRTNEIIRYSKDKTNVDYLSDLSGSELKPIFQRVTTIYNYVWYGEMEIAEEQFLIFEKSFQTIFNTINVKE